MLHAKLHRKIRIGKKCRSLLYTATELQISCEMTILRTIIKMDKIAIPFFVFLPQSPLLKSLWLLINIYHRNFQDRRRTKFRTCDLLLKFSKKIRKMVAKISDYQINVSS